jgi:hypothetical protein
VTFKDNIPTKMKQIVLLFGLLVLGAVSARPRYLVIPIEDVEFMENMELPVYSMPQLHHRIRRQAPDEQQVSGNNGSPVFIEPAQRRDDGIPAFSIPAEIRQAEDAITAGSNNYAHGSHGPDYVDYGAYTGGYGAFGWYSDHPVGGGYHR